jgi:hypothetical protein
VFHRVWVILEKYQRVFERRGREGFAKGAKKRKEKTKGEIKTINFFEDDSPNL